MKKKKKVDIVEMHSLVPNSQNIRILVSEEDKTGCDIMAMSDFFTIALREMSKELTISGTFLSFNKLPLADISVLNEAIHAVGVFSSPEFELIPDFSSLPKDIQEKYRAGKLILGESKQVDGNVRAVLVDADTKVRVKDVTFKKVEKTDVTNDIFQNILTQMQLRQISDKLDYMASEQSYLIDFTRNQAIIRPFLDARDDILNAQNQISFEEQMKCLERASEKLQTAINAVYVDMNTIGSHLAEEINKRWCFRLNRNNIDKQISRFTKDLQIVTKYVGMQVQVYHYLGDKERAKSVLGVYQGAINRLFDNGVVDVNKSIALLIHENIEYGKNNMDCWYNMEKEIKPMIQMAYDKIETKDVYVITKEDM